MIAFICYFFPAVAALWLYETLTKKKLGIKQIVFRFCTNALVINFVCFAIKRFLLHSAGETMYSQGGDMLPVVAFNYIIMAGGTALIFTFAEVLLSKKVRIAVEENDEEEKN